LCRVDLVSGPQRFSPELKRSFPQVPPWCRQFGFRWQSPGRIVAVQVIDGARLHVRRIFALAQRRRDARHHTRGDASDLSRGSTMDVAAENSDDAPGMLQRIAQ
jgi:hypothetical protein